MGIGLVVSGVATYVFLGISSRQLDADAYSALGVLWSLLFAVGNGLMQPLEQEVARAVAARRVRGEGAGPVIRRAAVLGVGFFAGFLVVGLVLHGWLVGHLFDEHESLYVLFLAGVGGFGAAHLARGTLSAHGRFGAYAGLFATEGAFRPLAAAVLAAVGASTVGAYGLVAVAAPFIGVAVALAPQRGLLPPGEDAPWAELSTNLGWLLVATGSIALVLNSGVVAVEVLAGPGEEEAAGVFLNGLTVARVPLFLFQAVLAALLPKLSRQLAHGATGEFVSGLRRLLAALAALGVVAVGVAGVAGPAIVEVVFGGSAVLSRTELVLLTSFASLFMLAGTLAQALIALNGHARLAAGSVLGLASLVLALSVPGADLYVRVGLALVVSSLVTLVWMAVCVILGVGAHRPVHELDLAEELAELPLQA